MQAELSSDPIGIDWVAVRSPIQTLGCSRITIPTTIYKSPVKAVLIFYFYYFMKLSLKGSFTP